jgi:hypothetical protein
MSAWNGPLLAGCAVLILVLAGAGCISVSIGDVAYRNNTLAVTVINNGEPGDAFIQVTVYEINNFQQRKMTVVQVPYTLQRGENIVPVPANLPQGTYKLYVYIMKQDQRQTATIRDIVV